MGTEGFEPPAAGFSGHRLSPQFSTSGAGYFARLNYAPDSTENTDTV